MPENPQDDPQPLPPSRPFLIALAVILVGLVFVVVWPYLAAVVFALLLGFLLQPVHRWFMRWIRWPTLAAALLTLIVGVVLVAPFLFIAWEVYKDLVHLVGVLQDPDALRSRLADVLEPFGLDPETVIPYLTGLGEGIAGHAVDLVVPTVRFLVDFVLQLLVFFFLMFFAIRDGPGWIDNLRDYIPLSPDDTKGLFVGAGTSIRAITLGTFGVAALQGIVAGIGWWLFGFPEPLFWGFVIVFVGILPVGAPFLITLPAGIVAIAQGDLFAGIGIIIYTVTLVALTDDLLRPLVVGKAAGIHPGLVLIGALGGITVFGVAGFLLGPLIFALVAPVLDVWAQRRRQHFGRGASSTSGSA